MHRALATLAKDMTAEWRRVLFPCPEDLPPARELAASRSLIKAHAAALRPLSPLALNELQKTAVAAAVSGA